MTDPIQIKKIITDTISLATSLTESARAAMIQSIQSLTDEETLAFYNEIVEGGEDFVQAFSAPKPVESNRKQEDEFIIDVTKELQAQGADALTTHNTVDTLVNAFSSKKVAIKSE